MTQSQSPVDQNQQADSTARAGEASTALADKARTLYRPPFRYERGYIFDAANNMVADDHVEDQPAAAARVRGWGRIGYMDNAESLQDEAGRLIAAALTKYWEAA